MLPGSKYPWVFVEYKYLYMTFSHFLLNQLYNDTFFRNLDSYILLECDTLYPGYTRELCLLQIIVKLL